MIPPCTCYGVTLTHDQLFVLRHFVHVRDGRMVGAHVALTGTPNSSSHDEFKHLRSLFWDADSGVRVDACHVHPDKKQYGNDILNERVTHEILVAERIERGFTREHPLTRAAWQRVSWAEERIARCEQMSENLKLIAQRGAIEAAERAGDNERVEALRREWGEPLGP